LQTLSEQYRHYHDKGRALLESKHRFSSHAVTRHLTRPPDAQAERELANLEETVRTKTQEMENLMTELESLKDREGDELEMGNNRLKLLKEESEGAGARRAAKEKELSKVKTERQQCEAAVTAQIKKIKHQVKEFDESRKRLDQLQDKKNRLMSEMDHAQAQQRELGSLPEAFEKYKNKSNKSLHDALHKVAEKLKAFKDVNKKALDQFNQVRCCARTSDENGSRPARVRPGTVHAGECVDLLLT